MCEAKAAGGSCSSINAVLLQRSIERGLLPGNWKNTKSNFTIKSELMKIAVTSTGPTLEHYVGTRAGHCGYLLIIDLDTMQYEAMQNPLVALRGPAAGKMFAMIMLQENVHIILVGACGLNRLKVLSGAGIAILVGMTGCIRGIIDQFKRSCSNGASGIKAGICEISASRC